MICDVAYVVLVDRVRANALSDRVVNATLLAAGAKDRFGQPPALPDPDDEVQRFDERLARPLRFEQMRQAALREIA